MIELFILVSEVNYRLVLMVMVGFSWKIDSSNGVISELLFMLVMLMMRLMFKLFVIVILFSMYVLGVILCYLRV